MLGLDYIEIDGVGFTPSSFSYQIQTQEEINTSAAGTELINIQRLNKHIFTASWNGIDSTLLEALEAICMKPTVILTYKETDYTCRARGINPQLLGKSYKYRRSDGLWNAQITLTQL